MFVRSTRQLLVHGTRLMDGRTRHLPSDSLAAQKARDRRFVVVRERKRRGEGSSNSSSFSCSKTNRMVVCSRLDAALPVGIQWNEWRSRQSWQKPHATAAAQPRESSRTGDCDRRTNRATGCCPSRPRNNRKSPTVDEFRWSAAGYLMLPLSHGQLPTAEWRSPPVATSVCFRLCTRAKVDC
jgi:hypothetical protein